MTERADFLVNNRSPRYLHGFQKDTNETTELPHTVPVDNQVTYIDSFTNYGVDTVYGKEYVIAAGSSPTVHNSLSGRADADTHPASSITNTPAGNIAATTVQAAINELDSEKAQLAGTLTNQRVPFANASGFLTDNANFYYVAGTGLRVSDATASTNTTSGAFVIVGGVGVSGSLNVGGIVSFSNTTASTSPTSGALLVSGGLGCGGAIWAAGSLNTTSGAIRGGELTRTGDTTFRCINAGGTLYIGLDNSTGGGFGAGAYGAFIYAETTTPMSFWTSSTKRVQIESTGEVKVLASTASTSPSTGALIVTGGVGCSDYFTGKYRSSDGTAGLTATRTFYAASSSGGAVNVLNTVTIKDGIITSWTQA